MQGNWGEMVLESVLESSGLTRGREYDIQVSDTIENDDGTSRRAQPDVIIHLPEGKHIIIDAKVSLTAYVRYTKAANIEDQKKELTALFDEFENYQTPESKFAHSLDNLQPLLLNNSNGGGDWREHQVTSEQVYGRQRKTQLGSETLYKVTDQILKENIEKGNIKES